VLVFAGGCYYPNGGWHDWLGEANTIAEAEDMVRNSFNEWFHFVEGNQITHSGLYENGKIIHRGCCTGENK